MIRSRGLFLAVTLLLNLTPSISCFSAETHVSAADALHKLFEDEWEWTLRVHPEFASYLGDLRYNRKWDDVSLQAIERRLAHQKDILERLKKIDTSELSKADRINQRLFQRKYETSVEGHQYRWYLLPLTARDGIQDASSLADTLRFETVNDYDDWIARLRAFPTLMDQTLTLMQEGVRTGMLHAKVVMDRVPAQIERQVVSDPTKSLFFKPFRTFPEDITDEEQKRLIKNAKEAITTSIVPAYKKLQKFFNETYLPACYDKVGIWQMPDGQALYSHRAKSFTTTNLSPKEIHEIGLKEVKRIRAEMEEVVKQVKFAGTFEEFLQELRTNPKFYHKNANDLLAAYRAIGKKVDPQLPKLFRRLPRIPYGVEPIPMHLAPDTTTAYYRPPSADGSRVGTYFVNLYKPDVRPTYEIEALSLHEAVPGHHLQIALAMELDNLPPFRRYTGYTAFVEGWALYAEGLGEDLGLYQDPYSKFGQLTYEMWRAVRLVVDTGMHSFQWSRQESIDFFAANTAKTMLDIENEIDRYIAWPGQALAYKIGQLKISELRAKAEEQLGDEFDLREFHDVVLSNGAVTLDVLEQIIQEWLASKRTDKG